MYVIVFLDSKNAPKVSIIISIDHKLILVSKCMEKLPKISMHNCKIFIKLVFDIEL